MIQEKHRFRLFPEVAMAAEADQVAAEAAEAAVTAVAVPAEEAVQEEAEAPAEHRWF